MRKTSLLTILGLLLFAAALIADEPRSEDQLPAEPELAAADEIPSTADPSQDLQVEDWNLQPEWVAFPKPQPVPDYCPDCQPCSHTAECGRDPHNGSSLGVCSPPPNSYCPGTTTSVCICY